MSRKDDPTSSGAPNPDRWYPLSLGSSFKDHPSQPSSKFCTLRYEFKPASFDNTQPGTLTKSKDNKVNVEFNNNQPGKPKLTFQGISEDCKENDAVLFFDGRGFRLERLHRAVKRLRHNRLPGESSAASAAAALDATSPPLGRAGSKGQQLPGLNNRGAVTNFTPPPPQPQQQSLPPPPPPVLPPVSVEVERIDIGVPGISEEPTNEKPVNSPLQLNAAATPDSKDFDLEAHLDIMNDDDDDDAIGPINGAAEENTFHNGIDINLPHHNDSDDEIADVDVNDDNGVVGGNAAAALRAQVHKQSEGQTSSSSTSSESETSGSSSGSGSGSSRSSSDSESSDGDSVNSI